MKMKNFLDFLKNFSKGDMLILSHHNSDPDAVCSSIALKEAITKFNPHIAIKLGAAKSVSKFSKGILEEFSTDVVINPSLDVDLLVLIDTATLQQIAPLDKEINKSDTKKIVIDHHAQHKDTKDIADFYIVKEASSTAEIVYHIIKKMELEITDRVGLAVLLGILADTAHLKFATPKTLQTINEILEDTGVDYNKALGLLEVPEDLSQRIAHLKAAQRMELYRVMDWIIITSEVSAFGASAARALTLLGADCAFVGSVNKDEVHISARATTNFIRETRMHLGKDIMPQIGGFIKGSGGGHKAAAGAEGKGEDITKALAECVRLVQEFLHV